MPRLAPCLLCLLLLAACDSTDPWDPGVPDIPRTDVYLANFSAEMVLEVYLRPAGGAQWGANLLTQPISGGNLYAYVGEVISGRYDVRMVGEVQTQEAMDMNLVSGYIAVSFQAAPTP